MKIICIGDSLTYGYGVPSSANWVTLANNIEGVELINKGINGDTAGGMLTRFQKDVIDEKAKYVIIMGGANDIIVGNVLGNIQANIMAMVHQACHHRIIPIIGIGICADIDNFRSDWAAITDLHQLNQQIAGYRKWILLFCRTFKVMCIDFYQEFDHKTNSAYSEYLLDGLHPTEEGHAVMADIVRTNLKDKIIKRI